MPGHGADRRTKYRDEDVAPHGKERRKQLQKIYEKNTTRISHLIYHLSFLTALLIGRGDHLVFGFIYLVQTQAT